MDGPSDAHVLLSAVVLSLAGQTHRIFQRCNGTWISWSSIRTTIFLPPPTLALPAALAINSNIDLHFIFPGGALHLAA